MSDQYKKMHLFSNHPYHLGGYLRCITTSLLLVAMRRLILSALLVLFFYLCLPRGGRVTYLHRKFERDTQLGASQVAQWKRIHLPMQEIKETRVQSLSQENPLEKEMATPSSILAWKILWTEKPGRLQSVGSQRVRHD